jgi:6-phosphogluconolactonase (cycloisomerase 2 family)
VLWPALEKPDTVANRTGERSIFLIQVCVVRCAPLRFSMSIQRNRCFAFCLFDCFLIALFATLTASCGGVSAGSQSANSISGPTSGTPATPTSTNNPSPGAGGASPLPSDTPVMNSGAEFVYAIAPENNNQSSFTVYQIDQSSGALTAITTATIPVHAAQNLAVDASGRNFYVTGSGTPGTNLDLVRVDPGTHDITPMPGQTFHTLPAFVSEGDCCANAVAVDGSGKFAYVGGLNDGSIHVYSVDQNSGTWTEISASNSQPSSGGGPVYTVVMHPTNKFLYESQKASSFVSLWSRNQSSGVVTPAPDSPFETGALTSSVSLSADGKFLFGPQYETSRVSVYAVNADGTLSAAAGSPISAGNAPTRAVTDPQNRFLFVLNSGAYNGGPSTVQAYTFDDETGATRAVANSTFTIFAVSEIRVDANGKFLYGIGGQTMVWSIDQTTGALTPVSGSPFKIVAADAVILPQTTAETQ